MSIVSTPIGNLGDITYRAIQTLIDCDIILAEDTRTTAKLLAHYQIPHKELASFFEGNEGRRINSVIAQIKEGKHIAIVSESGTPLISDPGYKLVREAISMGMPIESIPGPTAFVSALSISGLPTNAFLFLGFLPKKEAHAKRLFLSVRDTLHGVEQLKTVIFYESPFRLLKSLNLVKQVFGEADVAVARELTKIHEEVKSGRVTEIIAHFEKIKPRGELVVLLTLD